MNRAKTKQKTVVIRARCDLQLKERVAREAMDRDLEEADIVRLAVREFLERQDVANSARAGAPSGISDTQRKELTATAQSLRAQKLTAQPNASTDPQTSTVRKLKAPKP